MEEEIEEKEKDIQIKILVSHHPLSNIEITKNSNYEPRFNGVFSGNNLSTIKGGMYVRNVDDEKVKEQIGFQYLFT